MRLAEVELVAGGVLGEGEAQDEQLLAFDAVGDHAAVPEAEVELAVDRLGVGAVRLDELVGQGVLRDLLEVLGAVEATLAVALQWPAAVYTPQCAVLGGGGDADGDAIVVCPVPAGDPQTVVPAALGAAGPVLEFDDGDGFEDAGTVVEADAFGDASVVAPQLVAAPACLDLLVEHRGERPMLLVDGEEAKARESVAVDAPEGPS
ncbi:hypothetical protein [Streptomyces amritsarensis]|uniref:hypothetical protein n=1 Tax=Streptomyces amritsarensis TaxID=681158 RepID=UPI00367D6452